jgi:hypothetical protein
MNDEQCQAIVEQRDTYRLRRGRGFRMHYIARRCRRPATYAHYCWQHRQPSVEKGTPHDER